MNEQGIVARMEAAERQAWDALGRYKFWMFGYNAARWVTLNSLLPKSRPNPFRDAVTLARRKQL